MVPAKKELVAKKEIKAARMCSHELVYPKTTSPGEKETRKMKKAGEVITLLSTMSFNVFHVAQLGSLLRLAHVVGIKDVKVSNIFHN